MQGCYRSFSDRREALYLESTQLPPPPTVSLCIYLFPKISNYIISLFQKPPTSAPERVERSWSTEDCRLRTSSLRCDVVCRSAS